MIFGVENHLMFMLPADIDEQFADSREIGQRGRLPVDERPVFSAVGDDAAG
jgi:hypothetical protein